MGRRSDHSRDEIKAMAIEAASKIVESEGFESLTARKVASKIGYTVGTLYHVFRNFDDLVIHLNARTIDEMAELIQKSVRRKRSPESRIRTMTEVYVDYATEHPDRWRLVFEHQAPRGLPTPELMKVRRDVLFEMVAENLRELSPRHVKQEIDHTATALWSGVHGICILALTGKLYLGGAFSMGKLIDTLLESVLNEFRSNQIAD
ncbi:MAG: TetR/AcrR family transcriptional regulator [Woeseiaceae bacterium]|nr:TetR/AcrR family transcriptional regulator [Woeseiaceae bacterium]